VTTTPPGPPGPIGGGTGGKKPKLKFKVKKKKATDRRVIVKARVNRKAKATFKVIKGRRTLVGRKSVRFKKRGRKRVKIKLATVRLGTKRPVKVKVVGRAKAGGKKSKRVKRKVTIR
jgi:hypothetical protein